MNEWSPGGSYSRPGTPSQSGKTYRPQWEECEKESKPLIVNGRTISDTRSKTFQEHLVEDVSKSSMSIRSKSKKVGNGVSDPRFKRVISSGNQNDACVGTERSSKPTLPILEKENTCSKLPVWSGVEFKANKPWESTGAVTEGTKPNLLSQNCDLIERENMNSGEVSHINQSQDILKAVEKLSFNHGLPVKSFSKESLSDCTVNTRNTSLASEDLVDEYAHELSVSPSATRVTKVQNWIQDQNVKLEKKQSVITVIGQTQEKDNLSSALREIDKRKKLVKELDKYAVCKNVIETDKEKEISDLVAKISSLKNSGKVFFDGDKSCKTNEASNDVDSFTIKSTKEVADQSLFSKNYIENVSLNNNNDTNLDYSSIYQKRNCSKKKVKKCHLVGEHPDKGKIREFLSHSHYQWILCIVVLLSGILCWATFFTLKKNTYISFDLFTSKPKPMTWYEKICTWIWEIFRPSANYKRTAPWHSY